MNSIDSINANDAWALQLSTYSKMKVGNAEGFLHVEINPTSEANYEFKGRVVMVCLTEGACEGFQKIGLIKTLDRIRRIYENFTAEQLKSVSSSIKSLRDDFKVEKSFKNGIAFGQKQTFNVAASLLIKNLDAVQKKKEFTEKQSSVAALEQVEGLVDKTKGVQEEEIKKEETKGSVQANDVVDETKDVEAEEIKTEEKTQTSKKKKIKAGFFSSMSQKIKKTARKVWKWVCKVFRKMTSPFRKKESKEGNTTDATHKSERRGSVDEQSESSQISESSQVNEPSLKSRISPETWAKYEELRGQIETHISPAYIELLDKLAGEEDNQPRIETLDLQGKEVKVVFDQDRVGFGGTWPIKAVTILPKEFTFTYDLDTENKSLTINCVSEVFSASSGKDEKKVEKIVLSDKGVEIVYADGKRSPYGKIEGAPFYTRVFDLSTLCSAAGLTFSWKDMEKK